MNVRSWNNAPASGLQSCNGASAVILPEVLANFFKSYSFHIAKIIKEFERDWFLALYQTNLLRFLPHKRISLFKVVGNYPIQDSLLDSILEN